MTRAPFLREPRGDRERGDDGDRSARFFFSRNLAVALRRIALDSSVMIVLVIESAGEAQSFTRKINLADGRLKFFGNC